MNTNDNILDLRRPLEANDPNLIRATMTADKWANRYFRCC